MSSPRSEYVCAKCGRPAKMKPSFLPLDERFARGYCDVCTKVPDLERINKVRASRGLKLKTMADLPERPTVEVVRKEAWDERILTDRRKQAARDSLMRKQRNRTVKEDDLPKVAEVLADIEANASWNHPTAADELPDNVRPLR